MKISLLPKSKCKLRFFVFFFFCLSSTVSYSSSQDASLAFYPSKIGHQDSLETATWNIEHFPKHKKTVSHLAGYIKALDVDFWAFQEVASERDFYKLTNIMPQYDGVLSEHEYNDGSYQKTAFLYKSDVFQPTDSYLLFSNNRYEFPRPALVVEGNVRLPNGSELEMMAITVHLKAFMNNESRNRRRAAMSRMLGFLDNVQQLYPNRLLVLMGDFNEFYDQESVFGEFKNHGYDFETKSLYESGKASYVKKRRSLIDHIITSPNYHFDRSVIPELHRDDRFYLREVSDHLPVVSVLSM